MNLTSKHSLVSKGQGGIAFKYELLYAMDMQIGLPSPPVQNQHPQPKFQPADYRHYHVRQLCSNGLAALRVLFAAE